MDALNGEIENLRRMKESDGKLSRSNERKLKSDKRLLGERLGAAVIYPEDRRPVPHGLHTDLAFRMKHIERALRKDTPGICDGRLYRLMLAIFGFDVDPATVKRYYYMSEEEEKDLKERIKEKETR